jgi:hypothetical protein
MAFLVAIRFWSGGLTVLDSSRKQSDERKGCGEPPETCVNPDVLKKKEMAR